LNNEINKLLKKSSSQSIKEDELQLQQDETNETHPTTSPKQSNNNETNSEITAKRRTVFTKNHSPSPTSSSSEIKEVTNSDTTTPVVQLRSRSTILQSKDTFLKKPTSIDPKLTINNDNNDDDSSLTRNSFRIKLKPTNINLIEMPTVKTEVKSSNFDIISTKVSLKPTTSTNTTLNTQNSVDEKQQQQQITNEQKKETVLLKNRTKSFPLNQDIVSSQNHCDSKNSIESLPSSSASSNSSSSDSSTASSSSSSSRSQSLSPSNQLIIDNNKSNNDQQPPTILARSSNQTITTTPALTSPTQEPISIPLRPSYRANISGNFK
jgi:trimeric autotransporter adhesin